MVMMSVLNPKSLSGDGGRHETSRASIGDEEQK